MSKQYIINSGFPFIGKEGVVSTFIKDDFKLIIRNTFFNAKDDAMIKRETDLNKDYATIFIGIIPSEEDFANILKYLRIN